MLHRGMHYFVLLAGALLCGWILATAADAQSCGGSTPCRCGDNVTASRTLTSADPVVGGKCSGRGLTITAANVVLNLGGNKLTGSGTDVGVLIAANNVTVENGGVDRFQTGVGSNATTGSTVEKIRLDSNTGDGILVSGNDNDFLAILAKRNGNHGVRVVGNDNRLEGHNDEYNGIDGIRVEGDNNELIANLASENAKKGSGNGITVIGDGNTLERNRMTKLNIDGIVVTGNENTLVGNQVTKQRSDGYIVNGADNVLTNNRATDNQGVGFLVTGSGNAGASTGNTVRNNRGRPQCSIYGETDPPTCITR
jgi:parallel beta-helix repeat protein